MLSKLANLESELGQARKLLEAPAKAGWWRRFWDMGPRLMWWLHNLEYSIILEEGAQSCEEPC